MRKLFTIVLALILAMGLTTSAFAEDTSKTITALENGEQSVDIDVTGKYIGDQSMLEVYSVDVKWGEMSFTYNQGDSSVWDPKTHTYDTSATKGWNARGNTVTVTNHSSKAVDVEFLFEKNPDIDSAESTFTGSFDVTSTNLSTAVGTDVDNAPQVVATLNFDEGTLAADYTNGVKLGTVTVKLSPAIVAP